MMRIVVGAILGSVLPVVPASLHYFVDYEQFSTVKVLWVLLMGTCGCVGALAGDTEEVLSRFDRSRQRHGTDSGDQRGSRSRSSEQPVEQLDD